VSKNTALAYVKKHKNEIEQELAEELEKRLNEVEEIAPELREIVSAMQELSRGGKRLRAVLTILGYELAGGKKTEEIVKAGVVMEIFHLGLLIQDDWMDRDPVRRGVKTIHTRYKDKHVGNFVAMLAGDYTFGWGMEKIAGLAFSPREINQAMAVWGKYFARVGYGQTLDGLAVADEESIMKILQLKSGEYSCVLPLLLGATLAGAKEELKVRLRKYGMELGWVFQLRDDYLSEWGESAKTGKPVGNDRREGKRSFATMYGRDRLEVEIKRHLEEGMRLCDLQGDSLKGLVGVMEGLLTWMATREN